MDAEEIVRTAYGLIADGSFEEARDHFAPDATWRGVWSPSMTPWCHNRDDIFATFRGIFERWPDYLQPEGFETHGNRVLMKQPSDPESERMYFVVEVRDGRIVFIQDCGNRDDALVAVGLIPQAS